MDNLFLDRSDSNDRSYLSTYIYFVMLLFIQIIRFTSYGEKKSIPHLQAILSNFKSFQAKYNEINKPFYMHYLFKIYIFAVIGRCNFLFSRVCWILLRLAKKQSRREPRRMVTIQVPKNRISSGSQDKNKIQINEAMQI